MADEEREAKVLEARERVEGDLEWAVDFVANDIKDLKRYAKECLDEICQSQESPWFQVGMGKGALERIVLKLEFLLEKTARAKERGKAYIRGDFEEVFGTAGEEEVK